MATPSTTGVVGIYVKLPAASPQVTALSITSAGFTFPGSIGSTVAAATRTVANAALTALSQTVFLLGTGMRGPRISVRRSYSPVYNDITGPELAFDQIWGGSQALVFMDLTRWNENIYQLIAQRPRSGATLGAEPPFTRGSLMMTEGLNFPLFLRFPTFDSHPYYRANGGVAGYRFLSSHIADQDEFETGTQANIRHLGLFCQEVYDPKSNGLALCDFDMSGVPAILPN